MIFRIHHNEFDKYELVFENQPIYIRALTFSPKAIEPELNSGLWLIVTFAVWSIEARNSVLAAVAFAREKAGLIQLGVRPFDNYEENQIWWPEGQAAVEDSMSFALRGDGSRSELNISMNSGSGVLWLVLKYGQILYQGTGLRSQLELNELMQRFVAVP